MTEQQRREGMINVLLSTYNVSIYNIKKAESGVIETFELRCWRRLLSPEDCTEIKPVNPQGNQLYIFFGRTDAEAESPILWPPDAKN